MCLILLFLFGLNFIIFFPWNAHSTWIRLCLFICRIVIWIAISFVYVSARSAKYKTDLLSLLLTDRNDHNVWKRCCHLNGNQQKNIIQFKLLAATTKQMTFRIVLHFSDKRTLDSSSIFLGQSEIRKRSYDDPKIFLDHSPLQTLVNHIFSLWCNIVFHIW